MAKAGIVLVGIVLISLFLAFYYLISLSPIHVKEGKVVNIGRWQPLDVSHFTTVYFEDGTHLTFYGDIYNFTIGKSYRITYRNYYRVREDGIKIIYRLISCEEII